jgi:hypothetical protein
MRTSNKNDLRTVIETIAKTKDVPLGEKTFIVTVHDKSFPIISSTRNVLGS